MNMASLSNLPSEIGTKIVKLVGENHAIRDILDFHLQDQAIEFQAVSRSNLLSEVILTKSYSSRVFRALIQPGKTNVRRLYSKK